MDPRQTHGAFSWMGWQGEDTAAARQFYVDVLGWTPMDMPMPDGSVYQGIGVGEAPVGGFVAKDNAAPAWLPYVTVDDVDARCRRVVEAGGTVAVPAFDAPSVGRIAIVNDPAGAAIAFITYPT